MTKIAITGDIHAHTFGGPYSRLVQDYKGRTINSRLKCTLDALDWLVEDATKRKVEHIIIAGDLFHDRRALTIPVVAEIASVINSIAMLFDTYLLVGNHDMSPTGDGATSLEMFASNCRVIRGPCIADVGNASVCFIPYTEDPEVVARVVELATKAQPVAFAVGHLGVVGGKVGPSNIEIPGTIPLEALQPFIDCRTPVYLAHYHKPQQVVPGVDYVGSLLQINFGEAGEDKRYIVVDTDNLRKFTSVPNDVSPRFVRVTTGSEKFTEDDYVHAVVESPEAAKKVRDRNPRAVVEVADKEDEVAERIKLSGLSADDMIRRYVKQFAPPSGVSRKRAVQHGLRLLRKVM